MYLNKQNKRELGETSVNESKVKNLIFILFGPQNG